MKHVLIVAAVLLAVGTVIWFAPTRAPLPITARIIGRTNHPAGWLRYLVAVTNQTTVTVRGIITGEVVGESAWGKKFSMDGPRFLLVTFRPGEGGLFACKSETNAPNQILVTYSADTKTTALVAKLRELRHYRVKNPRDRVPNARSLTLEIPPP